MFLGQLILALMIAGAVVGIFIIGAFFGGLLVTLFVIGYLIYEVIQWLKSR